MRSAPMRMRPAVMDNHVPAARPTRPRFQEDRFIVTSRADKPPILRFLVLFTGLLATAIALVLLSAAAEPSNAASATAADRAPAPIGSAESKP